MKRNTIFIIFIMAAAATLLAGAECTLAGFTGMVTQDVTAIFDPPGPPQTKTIRVFATFDDTTDEVIGVGAEPAFGPLSFTTDDPAGLRNDPVIDSDFPNEPLTQPWDSYVTIGPNASALNRVVEWTPGLFSPLVQGTSFGFPAGGWWFNELPNGVSGGSVLIAQFTIGEDFDFELSGILQWRDVNHPGYAASAFTATTAGGANGGACCLTPELCLVTTEDACLVLAGLWLGLGSICDTQIVSAPCHPGDVALHCVGVIQTCPVGGGDGPSCDPGPLIDPWVTETAVEPGDPASTHDFGAPGQAIPADYFGPGSDPFTDVVPLVTEPLGIVDLTSIGGGIVDFGEADTLILRSEDPFDRCDIPGPTEIPVDVEIIALSLKSAAPAIVTFGGGNPTPYNVTVDLSVVAPLKGPLGGMTVMKTHTNGGEYDVFDLPVQPRFTFEPLDDSGEPVVFDTGVFGLDPLQLPLTDGRWVSDLGPSAELLSPFCTDFHPGIEEEFPDPEPDCNNNLVRDQCDIESGLSGDCNFNGVPDECEFPPCDEDLSGNFCVDFADILRVISVWGPCPGCPEDLNGNDVADFADILVIIGAWGPCT
ncbi:MAG: hypothetical protein GY715_20110 [Planctomycetes bacterium]|nr:hypothetical protein [Planctomycetota bacterium]